MSADLNLVFCNAQNVFGNGTSVDSTDWIDWKVAQDIAGGQAPVVEVLVTTSFATGTSLEIQLLAVDSAGANPVVLDRTPAIPIAELVAPTGTPPMGGSIRHLRVSPKAAHPTSTLTHLRLRFVNVGNNTAGAVTGHIVPEAASVRPTKAVASGF